MIAPPAAGAPIFSASFFFVDGRRAADRRRLDRVALVVAARRERVEAHGDVRAALHLARPRRVGDDAADARAGRRAPSAPLNVTARARCAVTGCSTRLVSEPTGVSSTTGKLRARRNRDLAPGCVRPAPPRRRAASAAPAVATGVASRRGASPPALPARCLRSPASFALQPVTSDARQHQR